MTEKEKVSSELKNLQTFLKKKNITSMDLSKEMKYSVSHIIKVLNGTCVASPRFKEALFKSAERLLLTNLVDFYTAVTATCLNSYLVDSPHYGAFFEKFEYNEK